MSHCILQNLTRITEMLAGPASQLLKVAVEILSPNSITALTYCQGAWHHGTIGSTQLRIHLNRSRTQKRALNPPVPNPKKGS